MSRPLNRSVVQNAAGASADAENVTYLSDEVSNALGAGASVPQVNAALMDATRGNRLELNRLARNIQDSIDAGSVSAPLENWSRKYLETAGRAPPLPIRRPPSPTPFASAPPPIPARRAIGPPPPLPPSRPYTAAGSAANYDLYRSYYSDDVARRRGKFRLSKFQAVIALAASSTLVAASISIVIEQNRSATKQKKGVNVMAIIAAVIGSVAAFYSITQLTQRANPTLDDVNAASY